MRVAIINQNSEVLFIDSAFLTAVKNYCGLGRLVGKPIVSYICGSNDEWRNAVVSCQGNRTTVTCDICLGERTNCSRWRIRLLSLGSNQIVALGVSLTFDASDLTEREIEVMRQVALD